jgi:hypothetical protein
MYVPGKRECGTIEAQFDGHWNRTSERGYLGSYFREKKMVTV